METVEAMTLREQYSESWGMDTEVGEAELGHVLCGGLNKNVPTWLNAWSPVSGTVWDRLGDMALVAEVCHWGWRVACEVSKAHATYSQVALPL